MKPRGLVSQSINSCLNLLRWRHVLWLPHVTSHPAVKSWQLIIWKCYTTWSQLMSCPCQNEILTLFPAFQINKFHILFIFVFIMCVTLNSVWFLYFIDNLGAFRSICYHGLNLLTHLTYLMLLFHYQFPTVAFTDFEIAMFAQGKSFFVLLCADGVIYIYQKLSNYPAQLTLTLPNSPILSPVCRWEFAQGSPKSC